MALAGTCVIDPQARPVLTMYLSQVYNESQMVRLISSQIVFSLRASGLFHLRSFRLRTALLPLLHYSTNMGSQKRKAAGEVRSAGTKKAKYDIPEYHLAPSRRDGSGEIIWPAPKQQIEEARDFILKW